MIFLINRITIVQLLIQALFLNTNFFIIVKAFSANSSNNSGNKNNSDNNNNVATLFDRFRSSCPADIDSIKCFEPSLIINNNNDNNNDIWVAVYRTTNNKPSVIVKDEFLHAMRSATGGFDNSNTNNNNNNSLISITASKNVRNAPVAVARLRKVSNTDNSYYYVMDSLRCILKKENIDTTCDGGSEHTEAIATAVDTLLLYYLKQNIKKEYSSTVVPIFEGIIRTKATIYSNKLLEERGFQEIQNLNKDMTTHKSSIDHCLQQYATRSISTTISPIARQRAIDIVSLLGQINRNNDIKLANKNNNKDNNNNDSNNNNDYDPWAGNTII